MYGHTQDPHQLAPPPLGPGDFPARLEEEVIHRVLDQYKGPGEGVVPTQRLGEIMRDLGADWTEEELKQATRCLDYDRTGAVRRSSLIKWWRAEKEPQAA
jgi:Ca2+-binding EF-hand superfamily protein